MCFNNKLKEAQNKKIVLLSAISKTISEGTLAGKPPVALIIVNEFKKDSCENQTFSLF